MKLLTLADGYGDSIAVPAWYTKYWKWPEIIKLMTRHLELVNLSRYGAGNEFIVNQLKNNKRLHNQVESTIFKGERKNGHDSILNRTSTKEVEAYS